MLINRKKNAPARAPRERKIARDVVERVEEALLRSVKPAREPHQNQSTRKIVDVEIELGPLTIHAETQVEPPLLAPEPGPGNEIKILPEPERDKFQ